MPQDPTADSNASSPTDAVEAQRLLEAEEGLLRRPRDWSRWVVPVLAVAKSGQRSASARDKIFFPGEKKPLELPLASPALHVIKRVRDEAHRFAISYHRLLRKKNFLPGDSHHRFSE